MSTITSSEDSSHVRRRLFRNGAVTFAIAAIVSIGSVRAQSSRGRVPQIKPGTNTSFGLLKQINAGLLNVGYVEAGPPMVLRSSYCTAGPTTYIAMSMSPLCWRRLATG